MDLQLVFSTADHGHRLSTLYECTTGIDRSLLIVHDTRGHSFGAFLPSAWPNHRNGEREHFNGTGETFLFTLVPETRLYMWVGAFDHNSTPDNSAANATVENLTTGDPEQSRANRSQPRGIPLPSGSIPVPSQSPNKSSWKLASG